jgi:hypothetical protein
LGTISARRSNGSAAALRDIAPQHAVWRCYGVEAHWIRHISLGVNRAPLAMIVIIVMSDHNATGPIVCQ